MIRGIFDRIPGFKRQVEAKLPPLPFDPIPLVGEGISFSTDEMLSSGTNKLLKMLREQLHWIDGKKDTESEPHTRAEILRDLQEYLFKAIHEVDERLALEPTTSDLAKAMKVTRAQFEADMKQYGHELEQLSREVRV